MFMKDRVRCGLNHFCVVNVSQLWRLGHPGKPVGQLAESQISTWVSICPSTHSLDNSRQIWANLEYRQFKANLRLTIIMIITKKCNTNGISKYWSNIFRREFG